MDSSSLPDVIEQLKNRCEKIGLYLQHSTFTVAADLGEEGEEGNEEAARLLSSDDELKEKLESGDARVILFGMFTAKDLAFSDRIQNPDKHEVDTEFKNMMPTAHEAAKAKLSEKKKDLLRRRAAGEEIDILELLDDDED